MTRDDFEERVTLMLKTPEGREVLLRTMRAIPVSVEEMKETAATFARKHGKSMDDLLVGLIQSGELSESDKAEAMDMLGQMPLSRRFDVTN